MSAQFDDIGPIGSSKYDYHANYDIGWDTFNIYILGRRDSGEITHIGQPLIMAPHQRGAVAPPTIRLDYNDAKRFIESLTKGIEGSPRVAGDEWRGKYFAALRHIEDLRHMLNLKGVERITP